MAMIGKVRRMHFRQGKSVREIVRLTSLSRNTVRKWLKAPLEGEPRYRRGATPGKLSAFHEALKLALKADAHRSRHERCTARALHAQIRAEGYDGSYSRVTDVVRAWRQGEGHSVSSNAFVPLAFELGEAYQFDWSEEGLVVGGIYYRMQVAQLKLCASRAFWLRAYPSQGHEMLFDAHTRSFAAMGGIARRGIDDNMKTAVDKVKKGKGRTVTKRFAAKHHYGPYSDTLRHALNTMEGHFIRGLGDGVVEAEIEPTEDALAEAEAFIAEKQHSELAGQVDRVGRLIDGYQSSYGMELLASVHWVATHEADVRSLGDAVAAVHAWNDRKRHLMKPEHIASAWKRLGDEGWLVAEE